MFAPADFRAMFPEFANVDAYPDAQIVNWETVAYEQLNPRRLGASLDLAAMLYTAHSMVLSAREVQTAANGGIVGEVTGPVSSKAVATVSVGYATSAYSLDDASFWNMSTYGLRLFRMMWAYGLGPVYVPSCTVLARRSLPW